MLKVSQNLIDKYNRPEAVILVSSYPEKNKTYSAKVGGIASFAKNTVKSMGKPVIVLAEILDKPTVYEEGNALVIRMFNRNDPRLWMNMLRGISKFPSVKSILVEYDFALYGDPIVSSLLIPFIFSLRLMAKRVTTVLHAGVTDVRPLAGHLGLTTTGVDNIKIYLYNNLFRFFYQLLGLSANNIIVNEFSLLKRLSVYIPEKKLINISHPVDRNFKAIDKRKARAALGLPQNDFVILYFGFINWYKGADLFASTFQNTHRLLGCQTKVIMAGGESATLNHKRYYKEYFARVYRTVDNSRSTHITGFVRQEDIPLYFSACDLVVFPYKAFISASGPMSMVFSYNKPFIISKPLKAMFSEPKNLLRLSQNDLNLSDFTFDLNPKSLKFIAEKVLRNGVKSKMISYTKRMAADRSWENAGILYQRLLDSPVTAKNEGLIARIKTAYAFQKSS